MRRENWMIKATDYDRKLLTCTQLVSMPNLLLVLFTDLFAFNAGFKNPKINAAPSPPWLKNSRKWQRRNAFSGKSEPALPVRVQKKRYASACIRQTLRSAWTEKHVKVARHQSGQRPIGWLALDTWWTMCELNCRNAFERRLWVLSRIA